MLWAYLGDAFWVLALAIMFSVSRQARRRIPEGVRPPLMGARLHRDLVLWALPGSAFLLSLWFVLEAHKWAEQPDMAIIVFGVRATSAALLAQLHLRWLRSAMAALEREGVLKS